MIEEHFYFNSDGYNLYAVYFQATDNIRDENFIICHPFAEEKKNTQRFFVELARSICKIGYSVLLFDLRGCGDSEGIFSDTNISVWIQDINNSISYLQKTYNSNIISFIGLRFSAFLGLLLAENKDKFKRIIVIEPVLDLKDYFSQIIRDNSIRKKLSNLIINKKNNIEKEDSRNLIDFDGYNINKEFYSNLNNYKQIKLSNEQKIVLIQITSSIKNEKIYKHFIRDSKNTVYFTKIKFLPFWYKIGPLDFNHIIKQITNLCETAFTYETNN